jgi:hypothetical protein
MQDWKLSAEKRGINLKFHSTDLLSGSDSYRNEA